MKHIKLVLVMLCSFFGLSQIMLGSEQHIVPVVGDVIHTIRAYAPGFRGESCNQTVSLITTEQVDGTSARLHIGQTEFPLTKTDAQKIIEIYGSLSGVVDEKNSFRCALTSQADQCCDYESRFKLCKQFSVTKQQVSVLQKYVQQPVPVQAQVQAKEEVQDKVQEGIKFAEEMRKLSEALHAIQNQIVQQKKAKDILNEAYDIQNATFEIIDEPLMSESALLIINEQNEFILTTKNEALEQIKFTLILSKDEKKKLQQQEKKYLKMTKIVTGREMIRFFAINQVIKLEPQEEIKKSLDVEVVQKPTEITIPWYLKGAVLAGCFCLLFYYWHK